SHFVTDDMGHPLATNATVAEVYPELRRKYGDRVTYAEDPSAHLETEFRFDVLDVARRPESLDLVRHAIDFQVAEPPLRRAFVETYGVPLDDLFGDLGVAITTYRWGFGQIIHEATGIAWELYKTDLQGSDSTITADRVRYDVSRADFEKQFGRAFREP